MFSLCIRNVKNSYWTICCSGIHNNLTVFKVISIKYTIMQSKSIEPIHPTDENIITGLKKLDVGLDNYIRYIILRPDCRGYVIENEYNPDHNYSLYSYVYEDSTQATHRHEQLCNAVMLIPLTHERTRSPNTNNPIEGCRYEDTVMGKCIFENGKNVTGDTIPHFNPRSKSLGRLMPPEWKEEVFTRYENRGDMTRNIVGIAYLILGLQFSLVRGLYPTVHGSRSVYHTDKHSRIIFAMKRRKGLTKKDFVAHFVRTAEFKNTD